MGECMVPERVFGFESSAVITTLRPEGGALVRRDASLLSSLLKQTSQGLPPSASAFMDTTDTDSTDSEDEDMEEGDAHEEEAPEEASHPHSSHMNIPCTSDVSLKSQQQALKRFVYAHQIEEMRRQCANYFASTRGQVFSSRPVAPNPPAPTVLVEGGAPATRHAPARRAPGF